MQTCTLMHARKVSVLFCLLFCATAFYVILTDLEEAFSEVAWGGKPANLDNVKLYEVGS